MDTPPPTPGVRVLLARAPHRLLAGVRPVNRRHDDPRPEVDEQDVQQFYTDLPKTIRMLRAVTVELEKGRKRNRRLARVAIGCVLFVTASVLVMGWALDSNTYESCQAINSNARAVNRAVNTAIGSIRINDTLTPTEKRQRVAAWEQVRQTVPVCDRRIG